MTIETRQLINGEMVEGAGEAIPVLDPATEDEIVQIAASSPEQVDAAAIHATKTTWFLEKLQSDSIKPLSYVGFGLKAAQEHGLKTGFVSTTEKATVRIIAQKLVTEGHPDFDIMTHRGLGMPEKPEPDSYIHAFEALGIEAQNAIVIEDNVDGVAAAKTAGARVVGVPGAFAQQTDLRAADVTVASGSDIDWARLLA